MAAAEPLILSGQVQVTRGNRLPGPGLKPVASSSSGGQEVVAVLGRIQPVQFGDPYLPGSQLRAPILGRARSGPTGRFQLSIGPLASAPAEITVLLVVPGGFYLNRFEGSGSFAVERVPQARPQPIVLVDDRGVVF